jgi:hypothetical protein
VRTDGGLIDRFRESIQVPVLNMYGTGYLSEIERYRYCTY